MTKTGLSLIIESVRTSEIFKRSKVPINYANSSRIKAISGAICTHLGYKFENLENKSIPFCKDKRRIVEYYTPLALWIAYQRHDQINNKIIQSKTVVENKDTAMVFGVNMPQGCGKTTFCNCMVAALKV